MKVLFSNMPWWESYNPLNNKWTGGVRAGSRWPHTFEQFSAPNFPKFGDYAPYPFFMGYATTYCQKHSQAQITFRDSIVIRESWASYLQHLDEEKYDMLFIETSEPCWEYDKKILFYIAERYRHMEIILCGPLCIRGEELLDEVPIAAAIQGEYEKGALRVINGERGLIPFDFLTQDEMNAAPFPYYDERIAHWYYDGCPQGQTFPHVQVYSSRGCPFHCSFCIFPNTMTGYRKKNGKEKHVVRKYSKEYMHAFLAEMKEKYDFKTVYFDDDTFNLGDAHTIAMSEVCRELQMPFTAMCRADTISLSTWRLMKECGCIGVKIGFESGDQRMIDTVINKHLDLEHAREAVKAMKACGLSVHGTFTEGYPDETEESRQLTQAYMKDLCLDTHQLSCIRFASGTAISEKE